MRCNRDARDADAVVRCVARWVDDGTETGYGDGVFHGWSPGRWTETGYHVDVDCGAQLVDWSAAIGDLARRLAACATVHDTGPLSVRLGPPDD